MYKINVFSVGILFYYGDKRSPGIISTISGTVHQLYDCVLHVCVCVCNVCLEKKKKACVYTVYMIIMIFNMCSHHTLYNMHTLSFQCEAALPGQPE